MTPAPAAAASIVAREIPAGANVDQATLLTVRQMAEYIRQSMSDPMIQAAARRAVETFGMGCDSDQAKLWAVFWWVKHAVKFESDENTLLRLGRRGEQDLLISPSVLLRMKRPKEDCDGFSMLATCMLACLGVPVGLAAAAVDPEEPERWSHVFGLAQVAGEVIPIDASHGLWPGWMVPRSRISRWQVFNLKGEPIDVPIPRSRFRGLHGYVRKGVGDDSMYDTTDPSAGGNLGLPGVIDYSSALGGTPLPPGWSAPLGGPNAMLGYNPNDPWQGTVPPVNAGGPVSTLGYPSGSPSSNSTPSWLSSLVNNSFGLATKVLAPNYQSTYVRDPVTGQLVQSTIVRSGSVPGGSLLGSSTGSGISPTMMLVGLGLLLGVGAIMSKGR